MNNFQSTNTNLILEIEFKFFIDRPSAELLENLKPCPEQKLITQYIFSQAQTQEVLLPLLFKYLPLAGKNQDLTNLKGRVRSIMTHNSKKYLLGLKGPKDEKFKKLDIVSKPELEVEISAEEFEHFSKLADKGYVIKNRTVVPCLINYQNDTVCFFAEFDQILEVNGTPLKAKFLLVEIEIPERDSARHIQAVRNGTIHLTFPNKTIDFSQLAPIEVAVDCPESYSILMSSRKLIANISDHLISANIRKYFDEQ